MNKQKKTSLVVSKEIEEQVTAMLQNELKFSGNNKGTLFDYLSGVIEQSFVEGQDLVFLTVARTGFGKSNFNAILSTGMQPIIREVTGRKRQLDFSKNVYWSGMDFLYGLRPIVLEVAEKTTGMHEKAILRSIQDKTFFSKILSSLQADTVENKYEIISKLERKYGYETRWLDEAQDLNSQDAMTLFNKEMVKIMSGIREMHQIYPICVPNPWLLNSYIREERVNTVFFPFPVKGAGPGRVQRQLAVYDLQRYYDMLMNDSKYVRRLMISPVKFLNRFRPLARSGNIPLFPEESTEWKAYKIMKKLATVKLPLQSIEKLEQKIIKETKKSPDDPMMDILERLSF